MILVIWCKTRAFPSSQKINQRNYVLAHPYTHSPKPKHLRICSVGGREFRTNFAFLLIFIEPNKRGVYEREKKNRTVEPPRRRAFKRYAADSAWVFAKKKKLESITLHVAPQQPPEESVPIPNRRNKKNNKNTPKSWTPSRSQRGKLFLRRPPSSHAPTTELSSTLLLHSTLEVYFRELARTFVGNDTLSGRNIYTYNLPPLLLFTSPPTSTGGMPPLPRDSESSSAEIRAHWAKMLAEA